LEEIEGSRLDALEVQLLEAETQLGTANLESRLRNLSNSRQAQQRIINDYTLELERLRKEVTTIEAIRNSLPETCFNTMRLEP
jgi:chromosome segregation ATPase